MITLFKHIIITNYLTKVCDEEKDGVPQCMLKILTDYENGTYAEPDYVQHLIEEFGEKCTVKAMNLLSEMYKKIVI